MILLTDSKINLDSEDHYGSTSLSIAARQGSIEAMRLLLDTARVDIDSRDCFGRTPLWYATRYRHSDITELLCSHAAKIGVSLRKSDLPAQTRSMPHNASSRWCDVCTLAIQKDDVFYECKVCSGGDFDICLECHEVGGRCLETDHELVERKETQ